MPVALAETVIRSRIVLDTPELRLLAVRTLGIARSEGEGAFGGTALDYEIEVVDGSIRIRVVLNGLLAVVITYGATRTGLDHLAQDGVAIASRIRDRLTETEKLPPDRTRAWRYSPGPTRLRGLFDSVASGALSPEEATLKAGRYLTRLADEDDQPFLPGLLDTLANGFIEAATDNPYPVPPPPKPKSVHEDHILLPRRGYRIVYRNATGKVVEEEI